MIDKKCIIKGFQYISKEIEENKEQLTYLDQKMAMETLVSL